MTSPSAASRKGSLAAAGLLAGAFAMLFAVGCEPIDATYIAPGNGGGYTDSAAFIAAHAEAWEALDYAAYEELLDDEFEFYPLPEDVDDMPWMTGDSWSRSEELGMVGHMFDPNFAGGNGGVNLIEFDAVRQSTETNSQGRTEVTCIAMGRCMWTPTDGASFDTRVIFELIERDGYLLIREITEIPRTLTRSDPGSVEAASLGSIKNLYR